MKIAQVHIKVKPECIDAFITASSENARHSMQEEGIVRFYVLQSDDDPTAFVLFEIYRSSEAQAAHKGTPHFSKWQADVKDLIVAPGQAQIYSNIFPGDKG